MKFVGNLEPLGAEQTPIYYNVQTKKSWSVANFGLYSKRKKIATIREGSYFDLKKSLFKSKYKVGWEEKGEKYAMNTTRTPTDQKVPT